MTNKEALERFKIDLHVLEMTTLEGHVTKQMEMYQIAIKALEERPTGTLDIGEHTITFPLKGAEE